MSKIDKKIISIFVKNICEVWRIIHFTQSHLWSLQNALLLFIIKHVLYYYNWYIYIYIITSKSIKDGALTSENTVSTTAVFCTSHILRIFVKGRRQWRAKILQDTSDHRVHEFSCKVTKDMSFTRPYHLYGNFKIPTSVLKAW